MPQKKSAVNDEIQIKQLKHARNQAEANQQVNEVSSLLADTLVYTEPKPSAEPITASINANKAASASPHAPNTPLP